MDKKIKISELPEFDATRYLEDEKDIAMYLTCVLEENDAALLAAALGDIAKALVAASEDVGRAQGAHGVVISVISWNEVAAGLYASLGYAALKSQQRPEGERPFGGIARSRECGGSRLEVMVAGVPRAVWSA